MGGARPDGALRGASTRPGRGSPGNALGGYRARLPRGEAWTPRPSPPATLGPGPRLSRNRGGPLQGGSAVCQRGAASFRPTRGVRGAHLPRGEPGFSRLAPAPSGGRRERTECLPHQRPPSPRPPIWAGAPASGTGHPGITGGLNPGARQPSGLRAPSPGRRDGAVRSPGWALEWPVMYTSRTGPGCLRGPARPPRCPSLCRDWVPREGAPWAAALLCSQRSERPLYSATYTP